MKNSNLTKTLSLKDTLAIASLLFGMLFGAGNLIFPVHMGQLAGNQTLQASIGFIITAVGIPLLAVAAVAITGCDTLFALSSKVSKGYGLFFTTLTYLTIGPLFAIPRCATVSFTVGIEPIVGDAHLSTFLFIFSLIFFIAVLFFSLRPNGILTWIGKIINPVFLIFYGILLIMSIINPIGNANVIEPSGSYATSSFFNGFVEGYQTMDVLACLCFGIIIIDVIRGLGVTDRKNITSNTIYSGVYACILMALIYILSTFMGANSRGVFETSDNGGIALAQISNHYFGKYGALLLALIVTFACLKTSIGLVTSCSLMFEELFPKFKLNNKKWSYIIVICSFLIANVGLNSIITVSIPLLFFIYPLAMTLILLSLLGNLFDYDSKVYVSVTTLTFIAALFDGLKVCPKEFIDLLHLEPIITTASNILPFSSLGFGWILPAFIGFVLGLILHFTIKKN